MSLTQALTTALSGLTATQTGLSLVAGNVANAQTPGYTREVASLVETGLGTTGTSVRVAEVQRVLDEFVQTQLRTESAGAGYVDVRSNLYGQLQGIYGTPGSANTLEAVFNNFTTALQALTTSPDSSPNRSRRLSGGSSRPSGPRLPPAGRLTAVGMWPATASTGSTSPR